MKKSNFVALLMGTVSGLFFALGMCMALLPEWNAFLPGILFGVVGLLLGLLTLLVWRKMEHKAPIQWKARFVAGWILGIIGALVLGIGICFCIVWSHLVIGTLIGILGIVLLLLLIPVIKGIK